MFKDMTKSRVIKFVSVGCFNFLCSCCLLLCLYNGDFYTSGKFYIYVKNLGTQDMPIIRFWIFAVNFYKL